MLIRDFVSRVRNSVKEIDRDSYLSNRHIWNIATTAFLKVMNQQKRSIYKLDLFNTVDVETEKVNMLENSCVPLNCLACRFKVDDALETSKGLVFRYISTPDMSKLFKLTSPKLFQTKVKSKKGSSGYAFYDDGYIYLSECFPCMRISYLAKFGQDDSDSCSVLDNEVNIPDHMLDDVVKMVLSELSVFLQIPDDRVDEKV